jgi:hypothetical protein
MGKPKPPDPYDTAAAQTGGNISTAIANAWMGNTNTTGPDGKITYDKIGTEKVWDPNMNGEGKGGFRDIPRFGKTESLSPQNQKIYNQTQGTKLNLAETANDRSAFLQDYLKKPSQYDPSNHMKWSMGLYDQINNPMQKRQDQALRARMAAQGLDAGTVAYGNEMQSFGAANKDARSKFALDSFGQGQDNFFQNRNQPLNEIIGLMSGSQIQRQPQISSNQPTIPTTDTAGLVMQDYQNRLGRSQMIGQNVGGVIAGLPGLAGMFGLSDRRAKTDIKKVGKTGDGQNIYAYRYKGEAKAAPLHMGLMAQEVEKRKPEAVMTGPDGLKRVHYGMALEAA